ncbi:MAG: outer membrane beta-barrel protein [Prolixibacteraceae bacterium]
MKSILILIFSLSVIQILAQKKADLSLSFLNGKNDLVNFDQLLGAPSYSGEGFFSIGLNYTRELKSWLSLETGLEYSKHEIRITPNLHPDIDLSPRTEKSALITIPVGYRLNFLNYAFINGGLIFDMDTSLSNSIDNQTGIGAMLGAGLKYSFKSGLTLTLNPRARMHSIVPFSSDNYHYHLIDSGIKFGIGYRF